jgi:hypothetical protein
MRSLAPADALREVLRAARLLLRAAEGVPQLIGDARWVTGEEAETLQCARLTLRKLSESVHQRKPQTVGERTHAGVAAAVKEYERGDGDPV